MAHPPRKATPKAPTSPSAKATEPTAAKASDKPGTKAGAKAGVPAVDPMAEMMTLSLVVFDVWARTMYGNIKMMEHVIDNQLKLMQDPHAPLRWHKVIPKGADWLDLYGKRHHDVDVERI